MQFRAFNKNIFINNCYNRSPIVSQLLLYVAPLLYFVMSRQYDLHELHVVFKHYETYDMYKYSKSDIIVH